MKITEIRGFNLSFPLKEPLGNALTFFRKRDALLVQIVTDAGISGWGEAGNSPHAAGTFVRARLARLVLGKSPADFGRHYQAMTPVLGYDRRGAGMMAISAIDMALHDLAARMYGISVASLLGGAVRDTLFAYASGPFFRQGADPYRDFGREAEGYLKRNFRAIKPRGGFSPRADGAMAKALRRVAGADVALMVDINQGYTARAAIDSAKRMEEAELLWIEEPVQPEDIPGYQTVARAVAIAIAGGEALGSLRAFREFLTAGTFSVLQPDLAVCGGYSGFREIAALARACDLPVMPHVFGTHRELPRIDADGGGDRTEARWRACALPVHGIRRDGQSAAAICARRPRSTRTACWRCRRARAPASSLRRKSWSRWHRQRAGREKTVSSYFGSTG